jgi:hypothetical protein
MMGGFVLALELLAASSAPAQPATCGLDPYVYTGTAPTVKCSVLDSAGTTQIPVAPTVYRFGEGVVHAPGSELAFVIVTNFDDTPQGVELEYIIQGNPRPQWRHYVVQAHERLPIPVHDDPVFTNLTTFNLRVFWPGDGDASLVMRPAVDAFSRATIPAPAITTGRFYTPPEN